MLKAGPPDVAGSLRGQECRRYVLGAVVVGGGAEQQLSQPPCLAVSLSLLPHCPPTLCPTLAQCHCQTKGEGMLKRKIERERKREKERKDLQRTESKDRKRS